MASNRQSETDKEKKDRRLRDTQSRKKVTINARTILMIYQSVLIFRKRDATDNQKEQERAAKRQRRIVHSSTSVSLSQASQAFISATKEGPDYVCICCN
jgi:hypothetical protein